MKTVITNFEITLNSRDTVWFKPLIDWLIREGCHPFSWKAELGDSYNSAEYYLTIESSTSNVLIKIAELLPDYEGKTVE